MAVTRKASAYSKRRPVVNTRRSKKLKLSYVKAVPSQKIVRFNMGNIRAFEDGNYKINMSLVSEEDIQIRDIALEAVRQSIHKDMTKFLANDYFFRCNVYPHNILRNNRIFSGGSKGERIQTGMSKSFGSPEGRAATIKKGRAIFTAYFNGEQNLTKVKDIFRKAKPKLACKTRSVVEITK